MSIHTLALTLTPIAAILWALLFFRTLPSLQQILGGIAVITGVCVVSLNASHSTNQVPNRE